MISFEQIKETYTKFVFKLKEDDKKVTFYLTHAPSNRYIEEYEEYMKLKKVSDIFCFCDNSGIYDENKINEINYHNLKFQDGTFPTDTIFESFDKIITNIINKHENVIITLHCEAGYGRAPCIIAYFMIKYCDFKSHDAITFIRTKRKGTFNKIQYKGILNIKTENENIIHSCCCIV